MNTSLTVDRITAEYIKNLSEISNFSVSKILVNMIIFVENKINSDKVRGCLIEYQRHNYKNFEKMDYYISGDLVDRFLSLRFNYRISISMLVHVCFLLFWKDIVEEIMGKPQKNGFFSKYEKYKSSYHKLALYYIDRLFYRRKKDEKNGNTENIP